MVSFREAVGASEDETVSFSWIIYPSREERDKLNAAVMEVARIKEMMVPGAQHFDCKRMAYGGFRTLIKL